MSEMSEGKMFKIGFHTFLDANNFNPSTPRSNL